MLSKGAKAIALTSRRLVSQPSRRFASHSTGPGGHGGSTPSALHVAGGSGEESFGRGFFVTLALIPLSMVAYSYATASDTPPLTRMLDYYRRREQEVVQRSTLHIAAMEQAASDRHMFSTAPQDMTGVDLRYPEVFNQGSPWNVCAGEGGAYLGKLIEHYQRQDRAREEARLARVKEGKIQSVYDDTTGGRFPSWMPFVGSKEK